MAKTGVVEMVELPKYVCIKCKKDEFYMDVMYHDKKSNEIIMGVMCRDCFEKVENFQHDNTD